MAQDKRTAKGRKKGIGKVTIARRAVQLVVLALFLAPTLIAGWGLLGSYQGDGSTFATPSQLPFFGTLSSTTIGGFQLLDTFALLQVTLASRSFDITWLLYALPLLVLYTLVRGRAFCGWVCPMNLLLELVDWLRGKLKIKVKEQALPRHIKLYVAAGVLVLSAIFCVPVFETFSPISFINKGLIFGSTAGLVTFVAIIVIELFWGHRVWCRSLCPLGGFYEVLGKVGQVNIAIDHDACIGCNQCKRACICDPVILDAVVAGEDGIVRAGDCMLCGKCIDVCPKDALHFKLGRGAKPEAAADGSRA
ncbi:MAG: 4Fe-4S binding protein [Coriobacteriales bacterium]|nr:4Fe-4S binding protein [Coriobacteriales bacterium]